MVSQKLKGRIQSTTDQEDEQKRLLAYRAYQQWLTKKKVGEKEDAREKLIQKERAKVKEEQKKQDLARAQHSYTAWKKCKDLELKLTRRSRFETTRDKLRVSPTPSLAGGYCSVWACDEHLADHVLVKVPREQKTPVAD